MNSCPNAVTVDGDDLISREELNEKIGGMKTEVEKLENDLKLVEYNLNKGYQLEEVIKKL